MKRLLIFLALCLPLYLFAQGFGSFSHDQPFFSGSSQSEVTVPEFRLYWSVTNLPNYTVQYDAATNEVNVTNLWYDSIESAVLKSEAGYGPHVLNTNTYWFRANYAYCTNAVGWTNDSWSIGLTFFTQNIIDHDRLKVLTFRAGTNGIYVRNTGEFAWIQDGVITNCTGQFLDQDVDLAFTYSPTQGLKAYTNGYLSWEGTWFTNITLPRTNILIGSSAGQTVDQALWDGLYGRMKYIALWNEVLSADEIALYATNNRVIVTPPPLPPITNGLLAAWDSASFDHWVNNEQIAVWPNLVANTNNWYNTNLNSTRPKVSKSVALNNHATLWFTNNGSGVTNVMIATNFFAASGYDGLELWMIYKQHVIPSTVLLAGPAVSFTHIVNYPSHQPYAAGVYYESFGRTDRPTSGASFLSTNFHTYNVASSATNSAYDIWVNSTNMLHLTAGYVFTSQGYENYSTNGNIYTLGHGDDYRAGEEADYFNGWIAAIYVYNRRLEAAERTSMRSFITNRWGLTFP